MALLISVGFLAFTEIMMGASQWLKLTKKRAALRLKRSNLLFVWLLVVSFELLIIPQA